MTPLRTTTLSLLAAAVLAACSSMPASNAALDDARSAYRDAQANAQTQSLAPDELKQAGAALALADAAQARQDDSDQVSHLAYLARQRVALAREAASRKGSDAEIGAASAERDQLRLAARTREADDANRNAALSNRDALQSQRQAEQAQRLAQAAEQQAAQSGRQASLSQQQAATARQETAAAQQAAAVSQQSAVDSQQSAMASQQSAAASRQQAGEAERRSQALQAQLSELNARQTDRGMVVTISDVLFDTGAAELKSGGLRSIERLGAFLREYPRRKVLIEGYTDSVGSESMNQALSGRRADAVRGALLGVGVDRSQLAAQGYGETFPVASNSTAPGRQMNRRVEVVLSDEEGKLIMR